MAWEPLPEEADLFYDVYIDESSQSKLHYMVLGGLVLPLCYADKLESDLITARVGTKRPAFRDDGTPRVMKWEKVSKETIDTYKKFVKTVFDFRKQFPANKEMGLHCLAVDLTIKPLKFTGDGDRETGFEKEFYFLCNVVIASNRYRDKLFCVYPDRRYARRRLRTTREILNYGAYKWGDKRLYPFRRLEFKDPETCQALQAIDIFIGALAFRLNRHYEKPDANTAKKGLADYIWELLKLPDPFKTTPYQQKRLMTWLHRPEQPSSPRSGPQNWGDPRD